MRQWMNGETSKSPFLTISLCLKTQQWFYVYINICKADWAYNKAYWDSQQRKESVCNECDCRGAVGFVRLNSALHSLTLIPGFAAMIRSLRGTGWEADCS